MRVGIFHHHFNIRGGAERVVYEIAKALDVDIIYTLFSSGGFDGIKLIDVSEYLPRWAKLYKYFHRKIISIRYILWEMIDLHEIGDFDIILSSGETTRAIITPEDVLHVHYLHTIPRWLYDLWHYKWKRYNYRISLFLLAEFFRLVDRIIDSRVDHYIVNSELVRRRLWKYLKRDSVVIHPPIRVNKYRFKEYGDFFLHIGRISREKKVFEVVKACDLANAKLLLIGEVGDDELTLKYIKRKGRNKIEYLGYVDEDVKLELLSNYKAVIYNPINEDFGLVLIEALASGKPVIINNTGYPSYLVKSTGIIERRGNLYICNSGIITEGNIASIIKATKLIDQYNWNLKLIRKFAEPFDFKIFKNKLVSQLKTWLDEFKVLP